MKIQHAFRAYIHNRKLEKLQGQLRGLNFMDVVNLARMSQRHAASGMQEVYTVSKGGGDIETILMSNGDDLHCNGVIFLR